MRERRGRLVRVAVAWTLVMVAIGALLAVQAMGTLYDGEQACFFHYPSATCPANDDPAVTRLTFAFFGVPLIWLIGIGLAILSSAWRRRGDAPPR